MISRSARHIVEAKSFQPAIVAVILVAGVTAGLETSPAMMERHGALLLVIDRLILGVFAMEAMLKIAAHGRQPWRYFADCWNVFDFFILVICLMPVGGPLIALLRLGRALRLLRLLSGLPKLQLLVGALLKSLSAMGYVGLLLALLFYIYAIAGIHLFGVGDPGQFGTLGASLLTLFRIVTLDNWGDMYFAQAAHAPPLKVAVYFASFIVLGTMITLNLVIGIIMNSMTEMHAEIEKSDREREGAAVEPASLLNDVDQLERQLDALKHHAAGLKARVLRESDRLRKAP